MKILKLYLLALGLSLTTACQSNSNKKVATKEKEAITKLTKPTPQDLDTYETAYFASGCFWCVEAIFESVKGVKEVVSGYSGGTEKNPTYEQVGGGMTSHAEAVKVYYDPKVISFTALVQVFFGSHDPTTLNRQGPDKGPQYRSIAFYKNDKEKQVINGYIQALKDQNVYDGAPITTEVIQFTKFYDAEDYHQDYERKHPNNPYITNVSVPRLNRFKQNFKAYLKEDAH
ncbi:peptide-methionine (S)-S-oxide reductase MsrA [Zobellia galactanivorans]|uniref:peptide-methionine (S)-S-oxide reductase MsrA n=1 Tax=Zobellia galactanivorans (strain DSM 12802 / CCUG 47099 / CIP 106680 / NCIMB 13871 / Dsij) TaxID=63186 RepID=UPI0026E29494|nr:peptide-methionine (S)-S-oxide reductase MsrA [Zobellia galactanivorans]MDO6810567.1 peptide-methionine (S)-S-oxide reductase MsrA [Zobellia galactanivorans]